MRLKTKKKRASQLRAPMPRPSSALESGSTDLLSDSLVSGVKFRALTIVDNFSRITPAVEVDFSLTGKRAVEALDRVGRVYGLPKTIRVDNGTEFCSRAMDEWAYRKGIKLEFIRVNSPATDGRPWHNLWPLQTPRPCRPFATRWPCRGPLTTGSIIGRRT